MISLLKWVVKFLLLNKRNNLLELKIGIKVEEKSFPNLKGKAHYQKSKSKPPFKETNIDSHPNPFKEYKFRTNKFIDQSSQKSSDTKSKIFSQSINWIKIII